MTEALKKLVGYQAVNDYVKSNMVVGLGTGSTAKYAVSRLIELVQSGEISNIVCVCTSEATRNLAETGNLTVAPLSDIQSIDVAIDGADEVDLELNLVKGRGAALLREKLVEIMAKLFIVVVDESKLRPNGLGCSAAIPVEIVKFGYKHTINRIRNLPCFANVLSEIKIRTVQAGEYVSTDNNNYIVDLFLSTPIPNLTEVSENLKGVIGVVEHGLFLNMANICLVALEGGRISTMHAKKQ